MIDLCAGFLFFAKVRDEDVGEKIFLKKIQI